MKYDYENTIDFARQQGREIGREEERICVAKNLLVMGLSVEQIAEATKLPVEEIQKLR